MNMDKTRYQLFTVLRDYGYILFGSAVVAVTFNMFLLPNRIAAGGVSGISTILQSFGFEAAYVQWAFNIPLFIAGVLVLGGKFGIKTLVGSVFLPFVVYVTRDIAPATESALGRHFRRCRHRSRDRDGLSRKGLDRRHCAGRANHS